MLKNKNKHKQIKLYLSHINATNAEQYPKYKFTQYFMQKKKTKQKTLETAAKANMKKGKH